MRRTWRVNPQSRRAERTSVASRLRAAVAMAGLALLVSSQACVCPDSACDEPEDDGNFCTLDLCINGQIVHEPLGDGSLCPGSTKGGTCQEGTCVVPCSAAGGDEDCDDGNRCTLDTCVQGVCGNPNNDWAIPAEDGNPCTKDMCLSGEAVYIPELDGTACGNGGECQAGICTKCADVTDCGNSTACVTWACEYGVCTRTYKPEGEPIPEYAQVEDDCRKLQCDGFGGIKAIPDESDHPADEPNECTDEICIGWTPVHSPLPAGVQCLMGTHVCNGQGSCVKCTESSQCGAGNKVCFQEQCFDCADGVQNGNETGIDCGGLCPTCLGEVCSVGSECKSGYCIDGVCCGSICGTCFMCDSLGGAGQCKVVLKEEEDPPNCLLAAGKACNGFGVCKNAVGTPCVANIECASNKCQGGTCWPMP